jgi:hypothetical protein
VKDLEPFESRDFAVFEEAYQKNADYDAHRLRVRRRLGAIAEAARVRLGEHGLPLERRDSLHRPFSFNRGRVVAQWVYLIRDAKVRRAFRAVAGAEVGADLDPAFQNAHLCVAVDEGGVKVALRVHKEAWVDAQNWKNRLSDAAGRDGFRLLLNVVPEGFGLRIHDWKKVYPCGRVGRDDVEEFVRYFVPGEHGARVFRTIPRSDPKATAADLPARLADDLVALAPLYQFVAWSPENDRLRLRTGG